MKLRKQLWATLAVVFVGGLGFAAATVSPAQAKQMFVQTLGIQSSSDNPSAQVVSSDMTATVAGASVSASDLASGKVTVLAYVKAKGLSKREMSHSKCFSIPAGMGFWNSGRTADGSLKWFWDTRSAKVCGNRKINCGNPVRFTRPKSNIVSGKVIMVRSFANLKVSLHAEVEVMIKAVCGWAKASASADVTISLKEFVQSKGGTASQLYAKVTAQATAKASAQLSCVVAPPPPPPPPPVTTTTPPPPPPSTTTTTKTTTTVVTTTVPVTTTTTVPTTTTPPPTTTTPPPPVNHPPTVTIPGPQHVFVNGTVSYCASASDPDGDPLTYTFTTSNGTVVGDGNCYHYRAPATPGSANVTVYVNDGRGGRANATTTEFPIVADDFGGG